MKTLFVKRSTYEAKDLEVKKAQVKIDSLNSELRRTKSELKLAERSIKEIVPRLTRIYFYKDEKFSTYRVCVDLHREMVERAFTHGSDDGLIKYTAEQIGRAVHHKMVQFNFARCEDSKGER